MERCDFSAVVNLIIKFIAESKNISQVDLMFLLFDSFVQNDISIDFVFDNGQVCRWIKGQAKISPVISGFYASEQNKLNMTADIEKNILPILYDTDMTVEELHNLIQHDMTVSPQKKEELCFDYQNNKAEFIARLICFCMDRSFVKRDTKTQAMLTAGLLSPIVSDYIYGFVPKPCKHFAGRNEDIDEIYKLFQSDSKLFIQGVAGIGKSEVAQKYAENYKDEYTNILYFNYTGDLKQMIADCDFADDNISDDEAIRFKKHNRFLRSLKEDTLIIIDNFNVSVSDNKLFDVIMKYRCRILFTTRSRFENYTSYDLKEIDDIEILLEIAEYFYPDTTANIEVVTDIIEEVYRHTLSVELAMRLLASGMLKSTELLQKLRDTKTVLNTDDEIGIIKDGENKKATYYQHIHTLVSLSVLSDTAQDIMRNMCLIPFEGIDRRLFAEWLGIQNLNDVNNLIELGFIQVNEFRRIHLHLLIKDITIDDTTPSVSNCIIIDTVQKLSLHHGIEFPYHKLMFEVLESVIEIAEHDDIEKYKLFLKDVFAYMENFAYKTGMELTISQLRALSENNEDKAILFDYMAAYEHLCNGNHKKALEYELKAVKLCDEILSDNPYLVSNIYGNLGALYQSNNQFDSAKHYIELAQLTLHNAGLDYTHDSIVQAGNYANLAVAMGEPMKAINALRKCAMAVKEHNSEYCADYANLQWDIGKIYLGMMKPEQAKEYFRTAMKIYNVIWQDEPDLINSKISELQRFAEKYGLPSMIVKNL